MAFLHRNPAYDPQQHITARQLRRLGFYLSETLPDDAYVRRVAVGTDEAEDVDDGSPTVRLCLLEPFTQPMMAVA